MTTARFIDRVLDAAVPHLGGLDRSAVAARIDGTAVSLIAGRRAESAVAREAFVLAANVAARLYPAITLAGDDAVVRPALAEITRVNPAADISVTNEVIGPSLGYETDDPASVSVYARGWNVYVDDPPASDDEPSACAALLAAVLGMAELFRVVFAAELGDRGRSGPEPGSFNLISLGEPTFDIPVPDSIDLGEFALVGAGAVGQATAHTLVTAGAKGTMFAIDDETIELSNLQRYVLAGDVDVGAVKVELLDARLKHSSLQVVGLRTPWTALLLSGVVPTLVAVDSREDRIAIQASLPGPIYNAFTQPADVGWSSHENFGDEACLACLYWPTERAPSRHEQVSEAFAQHPMRVLAYLVHTLEVGNPIPIGAVPEVAGMVATPEEAAQWTKRSILEDIESAATLPPGTLAAWSDRPLAEMYHEGICGGALLNLGVGEVRQDVVVPLAHQSVFAGVMLATAFIASRHPFLRPHRSKAVEARFDVLAGLPQVLQRPRAPSPACICRDADFVAVYRDKTPGAGT